MTKTRKCLSWVLAVCLLAALLPLGQLVPPARAAGTTHVLDSDKITNASTIFNTYSDGDILEIRGNVVLDTGDAPLVINKAITIQGAGGALSLRCGGILLEADVTFKDISLGFSNMMRNAIIANGYTLTLENATVERNSGRGYVGLFCGTLTGSRDYTPRTTGSKGTIIMRGNTDMLDRQRSGIFAGNYYDNPDGAGKGYTGAPDHCTIPASIQIDSTLTGEVWNIFACGAWMKRGDGTAAVYDPIQLSSSCIMDADVDIQVCGTRARNINGETYGNGKTSVVYISGGVSNYNLGLSSIDSLEVAGGTLIPSSGSFRPGAAVKLGATAVLGLNNFETIDGQSDCTIASLESAQGAVLTLGGTQKLTVTGPVTGTTGVALGDYFNNQSSYVIPAGSSTVHIVTQDASVPDTAFVLIPSSLQSYMEFQKNGNDWVTASTGSLPEVKVERIDITQTTVPAGINVEIPLDITYVDNGAFQSIGHIPLAIKADGKEFTSQETDLGYEYYLDDWTAYVAEGYFEIEHNTWNTISGNVTFDFTFPAEMMSDGNEVTITRTITFSPDTVSIDPPQSVERPYTGQEITGIPPHPAYRVTTGNTGTAIGTYEAYVVLNSGYCWTGGSTDDIRVQWSIVAAALSPGESIHDGQLEGVAPSFGGNGADGEIIGTTSAMEYAASADGPWSSCTSQVTRGLASGTYYVRMKATSLTEAGPAREVAVPGASTVAALSVQVLPDRLAYAVGDTALDITGLVLRLTMSDGTSALLFATNGMVASGELTLSGFSAAAPSESLTVTVTYSGKSAPFDVAVRTDTPPHVTALAVNSTGHKSAYTVGEALSVDGLTIEVTMSDGSKTTRPVTADMVSGFSSAAAGTYDLTVTYGGKTAAYPITVTAPGQPAVTQYQVTVLGAQGAAVQGAAEKYAPGASVTITIGARSGYTFVNWTSADVALTNAASRSVTFTMPSADVTLTANWRQDTGGSTGGNTGGSSGASAGGYGSTGSTSGLGSTTGLGSTGGGSQQTASRPSGGESGKTAAVTPPATPSTDGASAASVTESAGRDLVNRVKDSGSAVAVVKPDMDPDVTRAEVTLPASAISALAKETDAGLVVDTPVAQVSFPSGSLGALGGSGQVKVTAQREGAAFSLSITTGKGQVGSVPGGVEVTVPLASPKPGTVAVLVKPDGSREVVRKSLSGADGVTVPLAGSATVELVDNAKRFVDMGGSAWAQDAVDFVSSREILRGTGEQRFSPSQTMTRGMLVTALHNLESNPAASGGSFLDVLPGQWYAAAVSWAAREKLVSGYGDGSFGAEDPITREQVAVILWRYCGQPAADRQLGLSFRDAADVSAYSRQAMAWAVEAGVLRGRGDGVLDPSGQATRAEVAQMLKNFMERA